MNSWLALALAIGAEVIGTSALKASAGFSRLWPSLLVVLAYGTAFYFLSMALRHLSVGVAYAIWSGAGTVLITVIGVLLFREKLDLAGVRGIALILAGVLVLNLLSKTSAH